MAGNVFIFGNNLLCHEKSIVWTDIITGPGATVQYSLHNGRTTPDYKRRCKSVHCFGTVQWATGKACGDSDLQHVSEILLYPYE